MRAWNSGSVGRWNVAPSSHVRSHVSATLIEISSTPRRSVASASGIASSTCRSHSAREKSRKFPNLPPCTRPHPPSAITDTCASAPTNAQLTRPAPSASAVESPITITGAGTVIAGAGGAVVAFEGEGARRAAVVSVGAGVPSVARAARGSVVPAVAGAADAASSIDLEGSAAAAGAIATASARSASTCVTVPATSGTTRTASSPRHRNRAGTRCDVDAACRRDRTDRPLQQPPRRSGERCGHRTLQREERTAGQPEIVDVERDEHRPVEEVDAVADPAEHDERRELEHLPHGSRHLDPGDQRDRHEREDGQEPVVGPAVAGRCEHHRCEHCDERSGRDPPEPARDRAPPKCDGEED